MTEDTVYKCLACTPWPAQEESAPGTRDDGGEDFIVGRSLFRIELGDHCGGEVGFVFMVIVQLFSDEGVPSMEVPIEHGLGHRVEIGERFS